MKRYILCFLTFVMAFVFMEVSSAQTSNTMRIEGKPEILPSELIDKNIKDANGDICAAIKVISNLDGLTFNSNNGIIKSTGKPGEDIIYLQQSEQIVIVYKTGFKPLRIVMNEIGVKLQSGVMWKIEITGKEILIPINIIVDQKDADLLIDGSLQEKGKNTFNVGKGKHSVTILKTGYKPINREIEINSDKTLFQYEMIKLIPVLVTVKSIPGNATIFWNNKEKDKKTNAQFFEIPGKYQIRLIKYGYLDSEFEVEVKENGKNDFSYILRKNSGELTVLTEPSDAELIIDGRIYNAGVIDVEPGRHIVQISKMRYATVFDTLNIKLNQKLERNYTLIKNTGLLSLSVIPTDADVFLNDQKQTDYSNLEIADGINLLRVEADGYENALETIKLERGQKIEKKVELIPKFGKLQLTVHPVEAEVNLIKENIIVKKFAGSQYVDSLLAREYIIEVKKKDYIPQRVPVIIQKDQITVAEITLKEGIFNDLVINSVVTESRLLQNLKISKENYFYIINYDLPGKESDDCEITLFLMDKSNSDYSYEVKSASGDIGKGKYFGINKTIRWNWDKDFKGGIDNNNLYLMLKLESSGGGIKWYYWVGAAVLGGTAALLLGGKKDSGGSSNSNSIPAPPSRPGN